jgi:hypothetical protein
MNEDRDEVLLDLLEKGAIEVSGVDPKTGDILYIFTDKLKEIDPHLYNAVNESFYKDLLSLWEKGYISMDITQDNPVVSLTNKAITDLNLDSLSAEEKSYLQELIRKLSI